MLEQSAVQRRLAHRLNRKLAAYVASGVVSGMAESALGAIVHVDFNSAPVEIVNRTFDVDLNHDGNLDFSITHEATHTEWRHNCSTRSLFCSTSFAAWRTTVRFDGVGANVALAKPFKDALKLPAGTIVPISSSAAQKQVVLAKWYSSSSTNTFYRWVSQGSYGEFLTPPRRGFLGVLFDIPNNGRHTAWVDIEVTSGIRSAVLYGFAYETEPGKSIAAGAVPEPPSLALLAAGAAGLGVLRLRRSTCILSASQ